MSFNHQEIEKKWQGYWEENKHSVRQMRQKNQNFMH